MLHTWLDEIVKIRAKINEDKAALVYHQQRLANIERKIKLETQHEIVLKKCRVIFHTSALKVQQEVKIYLDNIVSVALKAVLEDPYIFEAIFETKHNETQCRMVFKRDDIEFDPLGETGGGAVDVAAFALRIGIQKIIQTTPTLFLDEPFRNISPDRHPYVIDLLQTVRKKLGLQIIMITHKFMNKTLEQLNESTDKVITIRKGKVVAELKE